MIKKIYVVDVQPEKQKMQELTKYWIRTTGS